MKIEDDSGTHATLADSGDNSDSQELPRGSNLGRYFIIEPIGSGGMGTVYRAYDPQLNRGVALKILSVKQADQQAAERAKARLIREAQALAQLSHPNVVAVHDAGTFEDDVFIAMELVEGKTLDDWMKEEKRPIKQILKVMTAAGRGLSAAHKAGLVHRDFKPGNVIVGDDGRVRVLDFGLARTADQETSNEDVPKGEQSQESEDSFAYSEISSDSSPNLLQSPLTHAGGVLGTPMYMAPEQHLGQRTDERTDQFGFCVVLYEALYGKRPFLAATMDKLKREVVRERVCVPRADTEVPAWLWQIVRKGLRTRPEDRFPTIDSLLKVLDTDPDEVIHKRRASRNRKLFVIAFVLITSVVPLFIWYEIAARRSELCKGADEHTATVWNVQTKAKVRAAFAVTGVSYAKDTAARVVKAFDVYVESWKRMFIDACRATQINGAQSVEVMDLRMSCLRRCMGEFKALVNIFAQADSTVVAKAMKASSALTGIAKCEDIDALKAPRDRIKQPPDEATTTKVETIRETLDTVRSLYVTGNYTKGLEFSNASLIKAHSLDYLPIEALALYWKGKILERMGRYEESLQTMENAFKSASGSYDDALVQAAATMMVWIDGYRFAKYDEALQWARVAENAEDSPAVGEIQKANRLRIMGNIFRVQGDFDEALKQYHKALKIFESVSGPDHPQVATTLNNMGNVYGELGQFDNAQKHYRKTLAIWTKALGPKHPDLAIVLNNMGYALFSLKSEYHRALEHYRKALAIYEKALGSNHPRVARVLNNMGLAYTRQGESVKALDCYQRQLMINQKSLGPEHPQVAGALSGIGMLLVLGGRPVQAFKHLERAVSICEKKTCETWQYGNSLFGLAKALIATKRQWERAITLAEKAIEVFSKTPKRFKNELEQVNTWLQKHGAEKLAKKAHK